MVERPVNWSHSNSQCSSWPPNPKCCKSYFLYSLSSVSNKLKMSKISVVLIKLFSVFIFSQSCDNSMTFVSNKLKMSKSELCSCHMIGRHVATSNVCIEMTRGVCFPRKQQKQIVQRESSDQREVWLTSDRYKSFIEQNDSWIKRYFDRLDSFWRTRHVPIFLSFFLQVWRARSFMSAHSYVLRQDSGINIIYTRTH